MLELKRFDKLILLLGFLIVLALFVLAFVLLKKGGMCAVDPIEYAINNNITIPNQYGINSYLK